MTRPRKDAIRPPRLGEPGATLISKSKYLQGLQCHKLLWHVCNTGDLIAEPDEATQAVFDQGHEVGEFAKGMFSDGVAVGDGLRDLTAIIRQTKDLLKLRKPLFEAAFSAAGAYCRVDILRPAPKDAWDIIEVKSTTAMKDDHLHDLAFQAWVLARTGLKVRACHLCHINSDFVRRGDIDPKKFFVLEDVTAQVSALSRTVEDKLDAMFKVIRQPQHPDIKIGLHCDNPFTCVLHDHCWGFLPPHNVLDLYRGTKRSFGLLDDGVTLLQNIPDDFKLTANQAIQKAVAVCGKPHVNKKAISRFLDGLQYPLHYLDFETFGTAIPVFDGVRPYQQIPFQFSLHIVRAPGARPEHVMFLAEGRHDPRPEFIRKLRDSIGRTGSVVAFNASFELGRLKECCEAMPEFKSWLDGVRGRVVDLLDPFKAFDYYHPEQQGSASMKAVLPALTGKSYKNLAIQEGGAASREFLRVTFGDVREAERLQVRKQLEQYCGQDTEGMIWITDALRRIV